MKKVFLFSEGNATMNDLLGGKGSNLAEMTALNLPVPQGFTISTQACLEYLEDQTLSQSLIHEITQSIQSLETICNKNFNDPERLLLVSVRSGAKISMPGMMDTILNLGLNDENVVKFAQITNNERFAYDCYRRFIQMFANVVDGLDIQYFEDCLAQYKTKFHYQTDAEISAHHLKQVVADYKEIYLKCLGRSFPQDVYQQIFQSVEAVFKSWNNERAVAYRQMNNIPHDLGTAVTIQEMVFGNQGEQSGTGVLFTRNPSNGVNELYGEYLVNAQGEDVVAGIRTPMSIHRLETLQPEIYQQILELTQQLEDHYEDMQDIEFTVEEGKLYLLQTRKGKRTGHAAIKIAVDMVEEGKLTKEQALLTIDPTSLDQILHPTFDNQAVNQAVLVTDSGLPASPGAASGAIVFTADEAKERSDAGEKIILVRHETSPEDIIGMSVAEAIVTSQGGMTSHPAVVARGMGKTCVAGCNELEVNEESKTLIYSDGILHEGDIISVDGSTGKIYLGDLTTVAATVNQDFDKIMKWSQDIAQLKVRMNAETSTDIQAGLDFDAVGIGLVRTEHMFFHADRIKEIRRFLLTDNPNDHNDSLTKIRDFQINDFKEIFQLTKEKPVVIRLLDLPLHEFLPTTQKEIHNLAESLNIPINSLEDHIVNLKEVNPMMGHRGCRMGVTYPELYLMQVEAIIQAAIETQNNLENIQIKPEIMIPLISNEQELIFLRKQIKNHLDNLLNEAQQSIDYTIGTMIETPRACLIADKLAKHSDFFSFGTNDLTQLTFGYSRDDAGKFLNYYLQTGILANDPFQTIDSEAMIQLVSLAVEKGRESSSKLKMGICGELGGDPHSIELFHQIGLDYVSCSPFRVPIAHLAAAQAAIKSK